MAQLDGAEFVVSGQLDLAGTDVVAGPGGQIYTSGTIGRSGLAGIDSNAVTNGGTGMRYVAKIDGTSVKPSWVVAVGPASPGFMPAVSSSFTVDEARGLAVRTDGAALLVAHDGSVGYPSAGGTYRWAGPKHVFLVTPAGQASRFSPALDPSIRRVGAIAVDASGAIYLTGSASSGLVTTAGAPYPTSSVAADCIAPFAMKLAASGQVVAYATYLGYSGTQGERCGGGSNDGVLDPIGYAVAVDPAGNAVFAGQAEPGVRATAGAIDTGFKTTTMYIPQMKLFASHGFVTKLNPTGTGIVFSARLGGSVRDRVTSVALDTSGAVYVGGKTASYDYPVAGPIGPLRPLSLRTCPGFDNAPEMGFVTKLSADGKQFVYSGFLPMAGDQIANCDGGAGADFAPVKIAVDAAGRLYATGTGSVERPFTPSANAVQTRFPAALLYRVAADGQSLDYATQYALARPHAMVLDAAGDPWVMGGGLWRFSPQGMAVDFTLQKRLCASGAALSVRVAGAGNAGNVEFFVDGASVGTVPVSASAASKTVPLSAGAHLVRATYRGAGYFDGYASEERYFGVDQAGACE